MNADCVPINLHVARRFIASHHYARKCPPHCLEPLGLFKAGELVGVSLWGWGVRPLHSIRKVFPSLTTKDYRELNRLCVLDAEPRNTESHFLALSLRWLKSNRPQIEVITSWADGMRSKPGFVYQAANWWYAGFITTEFYISPNGETVHPRLLITRYGRRDREFTEGLGLVKRHGRQFLYVAFLCSHKREKELRRECLLPLTKDYPKLTDCIVWHAEEVSREIREATNLQGMVQFHDSAVQPSLWEE